jgi:hypothetical protein
LRVLFGKTVPVEDQDSRATRGVSGKHGISFRASLITHNIRKTSIAHHVPHGSERRSDKRYTCLPIFLKRLGESNTAAHVPQPYGLPAITPNDNALFAHYSSFWQTSELIAAISGCART